MCNDSPEPLPDKSIVSIKLFIFMRLNVVKVNTTLTESYTILEQKVMGGYLLYFRSQGGWLTLGVSCKMWNSLELGRDYGIIVLY